MGWSCLEGKMLYSFEQKTICSAVNCIRNKAKEGEFRCRMREIILDRSGRCVNFEEWKND